MSDTYVLKIPTDQVDITRLSSKNKWQESKSEENKPTCNAIEDKLSNDEHEAAITVCESILLVLQNDPIDENTLFYVQMMLDIFTAYVDTPLPSKMKPSYFLLPYLRRFCAWYECINVNSINDVYEIELLYLLLPTHEFERLVIDPIIESCCQHLPTDPEDSCMFYVFQLHEQLEPLPIQHIIMPYLHIHFQDVCMLELVNCKSFILTDQFIADVSLLEKATQLDFTECILEAYDLLQDQVKPLVHTVNLETCLASLNLVDMFFFQQRYPYAYTSFCIQVATKIMDQLRWFFMFHKIRDTSFELYVEYKICILYLYDMQEYRDWIEESIVDIENYLIDKISYLHQKISQ